MSIALEQVRLTPRQAPPGALEGLARAGSIEPRALWAEVGGERYSVLISRDPIHDRRTVPDIRWHISVAGEDDTPGWREMVAIAHRLRPGVCFVIGVPPRSWWMSVHPHCLHLWEIKDSNLLDQWRAEARGDTPS